MRLLLLLSVAAALAACGKDPPAGPTARLPYLESVPGTDVSFDMVWIPDAGLWMGATEVTWAQYEAYFLSKDVKDGTEAVTRPTPPYLPYDRGWGQGAMPAVGISHHAAEGYCAWLSLKTGRAYRLPTETEWTAACVPPVDVEAEIWHVGNSDKQTHEVGTKKANALGVHDLLGNAWEYCSGGFADDDERAVLRGGCWDTPSAECTCEARRACPAAWNDSDAQRPRGIWWLADGPYVGIRVVRVP